MPDPEIKRISVSYYLSDTQRSELELWANRHAQTFRIWMEDALREGTARFLR